MKKLGFLFMAFATCTIMAMIAFAGVWRTGAEPNQNDCRDELEIGTYDRSGLEGAGGKEEKSLVVYFSKTGTTRSAAEQVNQLVGGDLIELKATDPYPDSYQATLTRAERELDSNARPSLTTAVSNMEQYDTIYLGYPIWHGTAPMCIFTFLESYDLSGKTIVPFCTSGGSGIETSVNDIQNVCPDAVVLQGLRAKDTASIQPWLSGLGVIDN